MSPPRKRFRLFRPILAGATLKDRLIASGGAFGCLLIVAAMSAPVMVARRQRAMRSFICPPIETYSREGGQGDDR